MRYRLVPFLFVVLVIVSSCGCSDSGVSFKGTLVNSSNPPVLLEVKSIDEKTVRLVFDKVVKPYKDTFEPYKISCDGFSITVDLGTKLEPGKSTYLSARVCDENGNTSGFKTPVWGYNPNVPDIVINELVTKDEPKTELLVLSKGNTAGMVLYNGVPSSFDGKAILPDMEVKTGDYIVVWWTESVKSQHSVDVLADTQIKGYSNNGIQTLAVSPAEGAKVSDCIVYSNFSSKYDGYGSADTQKRVDYACDKSWWNDKTSPVNSNYSTKTRSMSRKTNTADTDSFNDWFITVTGGATFGFENNSEEYSF